MCVALCHNGSGNSADVIWRGLTLVRSRFAKEEAVTAELPTLQSPLCRLRHPELVGQEPLSVLSLLPPPHPLGPPPPPHPSPSRPLPLPPPPPLVQPLRTPPTPDCLVNGPSLCARSADIESSGRVLQRCCGSAQPPKSAGCGRAAGCERPATCDDPGRKDDRGPAAADDRRATVTDDHRRRGDGRWTGDRRATDERRTTGDRPTTLRWRRRSAIALRSPPAMSRRACAPREVQQERIRRHEQRAEERSGRLRSQARRSSGRAGARTRARPRAARARARASAERALSSGVRGASAPDASYGSRCVSGEADCSSLRRSRDFRTRDFSEGPTRIGKATVRLVSADQANSLRIPNRGARGDSASFEKLVFSSFLVSCNISEVRKPTTSGSRRRGGSGRPQPRRDAGRGLLQIREPKMAPHLAKA